jgi:hypothetical protein
MNLRLLIPALLLSAASIAAQTPAAAPAKGDLPAKADASPTPQAHTSELGFSYSVPSDWEVVDTKPSLPVVQQQVEKNATSEAEKRGINCVQIALTARHGSPASVVVVVALPFDCFGQTMTEKDLPGFAQGAAQGLTQTFDISDPVYGAYSLGTHSMWIERSKGALKEHSELQYTVETVCTILKKGAVCWMALGADKDGLTIFESGAVNLDGDAQPALVPATAFDKKPS